MPVVSPEKAERRKRMVNLEMLRQHIEDSGITMSHIARRLDISRATIYNKLNGSSEFTASEIYAISRILHLSNKERDLIFLS